MPSCDGHELHVCCVAMVFHMWPTSGSDVRVSFDVRLHRGLWSVPNAVFTVPPGTLVVFVLMGCSRDQEAFVCFHVLCLHCPWSVPGLTAPARACHVASERCSTEAWAGDVPFCSCSSQSPHMQWTHVAAGKRVPREMLGSSSHQPTHVCSFLSSGLNSPPSLRLSQLFASWSWARWARREENYPAPSPAQGSDPLPPPDPQPHGLCKIPSRVSTTLSRGSQEHRPPNPFYDKYYVASPPLSSGEIHR